MYRMQISSVGHLGWLLFASVNSKKIHYMNCHWKLISTTENTPLLDFQSAHAHFTAVIIWRGEKYFYDGMAPTDETRLKRLVFKEHYINKEGSFAFYFYFGKL